MNCHACNEQFDALGGLEEETRYLQHLQIHPFKKRPKTPTFAERVAITKVWANRASGYAAIIQMGLIVALLVKNSYPDVNLIIWGAPIFVGTMLFFLGVGWFDEKMGVFRAENTRVQDNNTELHEILRTVKRLEGRK